MINIQQNKIIITAIAVILFGSYTNQIYGHNFAGNESASFLALMDQMQTEMNLINSNIYANNQTLAQDHLNKINAELYTEKIKKEIAERNERIANEISSSINKISNVIEQGNNLDITGSVKTFNDIIEEAISVRIDQDALTNATVQALHFANLINSIDVSYATAMGTEPMNMSVMNMDIADDSKSHSNNKNNKNTLMSNMVMNHGSSETNMTHMSKDTANNSNTTETGIIVNIPAYQTAKELTNMATDLFNSTIKQDIPSNATENAKTIESSLHQLEDMIETKDRYDKVMGVIHGLIHTNIQEAFNLPLKISK